MKKTLATLLVLIGLTFIYNPASNTGFVYVNTATENYIILVDSNSHVLRYYKALPSGEERLDTGFEKWLQDKINKGMPFKSAIIPYSQQYEEKSLPKRGW